MTLRAEGKIGGRRFALAAGGKGWVCLECMQETKPSRGAFERHRCEQEAAAPAAKAARPDKPTPRKRAATKDVTTPTDEVSDEAR